MSKDIEQKESIGFQLRDLSILISRYMHNRHAKVHEEINLPPCKECNEKDHTSNKMHGYVIMYLMKHEGEEVFQKDIEKAMNIRRSTATVLLQRMEKAGMLKRQSVDYDARLKRIVLTDRAKELYSRISSEIESLEDILTEGITEEELQELIRIVNKIKSNLERSIN